MKYLCLPAIIASVLFFPACGNIKTEENTDSAIKATDATPDLAAKQNGAIFVINTDMDTMEIPRSFIGVSYGRNTIPVDTMTGAADLYEKAQYKDMQIPDNALAACGGWYAGGGDYFYIVPTSKGIAVYSGYQDEEQEDVGYHWKLLKEIN